MSQIHFGVMYDTETGEFSQVALEEMPVDSKESVFDVNHDTWRRPEGFEIAESFAASEILSRLLDNVRQV